MAGLAKFNKVREKPLVLISPLDWGLGHTTRCIPLIRELISLQCDVVIVCSSAQRSLLEIEFQSLTFFENSAGPPLYGRNRAQTMLRLLFQVPKILTTIKQENRWLQQFLSTNPVDAIISDNRFGFFSPGIPCIFITHQLHIKTGLGAITDALAQRINYRFIKKFTACWVPDGPQPHSLAGQLSNPSVYPKTTVKRMGALSRFEPCRTGSSDHILIILSGPEPQRSLLENKIIEGLKEYTGKAILVRGLPGNEKLPDVQKHVQVFNHVESVTLNKLICGASIVISRCGYTTVMDLIKLQKRSVLIPTPGQAEQEYLAKYLLKKGFAYTLKQNDFSLSKALLEAERFPFKIADIPMNQYKTVLQEFVTTLKAKRSS